MAVADAQPMTREFNRDRFNRQVEELARLMCEEMDLDPEQLIYVPSDHGLTDYETHSPEYAQILDTGHTHGLGAYSAGGDSKAEANISCGQTVLHLEPIMSHLPRWQVFRRHAARALAAHRAIHRWHLTEA